MLTKCVSGPQVRQLLSTAVTGLTKQHPQLTSCQLIGKHFSSQVLDPVQEALLVEPCILVNELDQPIGQASKRECHLMFEGSSPLHRAFSLFIFNNNGDLLMQKRSKTKILFPDMWTNSCCSHPLARDQEQVEEEALGARLASQRRVNIELGIPESQVPVEKIKYLTRILYAAPSSSAWGEHELDYILMLRGDVTTNLNKDEVSEVEWVARNDLTSFTEHVERTGGSITPWFKFISQSLLPTWWEHLDNIDSLVDHKTIHKFY